MKTLKLNKLQANQISVRDIKRIVGGEGECCCGCFYANNGGSSTSDNFNANFAHDLRSPGCFLLQ